VTRETFGRFALAFVKGFYSGFEVIDQQAGIESRFNIAPSQTIPTIMRQSPNQVVMMKWGLAPFWAKDPRILS
jgi:putative SOS response-associated peptidase YedK